MTTTTAHLSTAEPLRDLTDNACPPDVLDIADVFVDGACMLGDDVSAEANPDTFGELEADPPMPQTTHFQGNFTLQTNNSMHVSGELPHTHSISTLFSSRKGPEQCPAPFGEREFSASDCNSPHSVGNTQLSVDIRVVKNEPSNHLAKYDPYAFPEDDLATASTYANPFRGNYAQPTSATAISGVYGLAPMPSNVPQQHNSAYRSRSQQFQYPSPQSQHTPLLNNCDINNRSPLMYSNNMPGGYQCSPQPMNQGTRHPAPGWTNGGQFGGWSRSEASHHVHPQGNSEQYRLTGDFDNDVFNKRNCRQALLDALKARAQPKVGMNSQTHVPRPYNLDYMRYPPQVNTNMPSGAGESPSNSVKLDLKAYVQNKIQMMRHESQQEGAPVVKSNSATWTTNQHTTSCEVMTSPGLALSQAHVIKSETSSSCSSNTTTCTAIELSEVQAANCPADQKLHAESQRQHDQPRPLPSGVRLAQERVRLSSPEEMPKCGCKSVGSSDERFEGPYYSQLGTATCVSEIRMLFEERTGLSGAAIRIERVKYTGKDGKTSQGCPLAKWVLRRSGAEEKVLVIVRCRSDHHCRSAVLVVGVVVWEGVPGHTADDMYSYLSTNLSAYGLPTERRCASNEQRSCACQGAEESAAGASFSFGCSWSMYYNGCKFSRSKTRPRKFKLKVMKDEEELGARLNQLADTIAPHCAKLVPAAYTAMCLYDGEAEACRLGTSPGRPWSGVTACLDFSEHPHKDSHNMNHGCTAVVSLCKHRGEGPDEDEQLHVLSHCVLEPDSGDDKGSSYQERLASGAVEQLSRYPKIERIRNVPLLSKRKRIEARRKQLSHCNEKKKIKLVSKESVPESSSRRVLSRGPDGRFMSKTPEPREPAGPAVIATCRSDTLPTGREGDMPQLPSYEQAVGRGAAEWGSELSIDDLMQKDSEMFTDRYEDIDTILHDLPDMAVDADVAVEGDFPDDGIMDQEDGISPHSIISSEHTGTPETLQRNKGEMTAFSEKLGPENGKLPLPEELEVNTDLANDEFHGLDFESTLNILNDMSKNSPSATSDQKGLMSPACSLASSRLPPFDSIFGDFSPNSLMSPPSESESALTSAKSCDRYFMDSEEVRSQLAEIEGTEKQTSDHIAPCSSKDGPSQKLDHPEEIVITETFSDNKDAFADSTLGGVAIALSHGSVLFEVTKKETRATTSLKHPSKHQPNRIALSFYQHKSLSAPSHGFKQYLRRAESGKAKTSVTTQGDLLQPPPDLSAPVEALLHRLAHPEVQVPEQVRQKMAADAQERPFLAALRSAAYRLPVARVTTTDSNSRVAVHQTCTQPTFTVSSKLSTPQPMLSGPYVHIDESKQTKL